MHALTLPCIKYYLECRLAFHCLSLSASHFPISNKLIQAVALVDLYSEGAHFEF